MRGQEIPAHLFKVMSLSIPAAHVSFFHALSCCVPHAVLLSYTFPDPSSRYTHTHTDPPTTTTTCFTLLHHHLFSSKWLKHSNCLPPPPPHLTVFYLSLFFFLLPCFSPFLLSVSIGGHGLGKPTEQLQNVEELVQLSCLFCQHGVRWHQLSICYAILYPSLYFFFSCSSLCHTLFPLISSLTSTLITVCLCLLSIIGQTNGLTE